MVENLQQHDLNVLASGKWPERYLRNNGPLTISDQIRLLGSTVAVAGCGGLGGYVIEMLARLGIGELALVDPGVFKPDNANRQLYCSSESIGKDKVQVALTRIREINPAIQAQAFKQRIQDAFPTIQGKLNVVVDCLDSVHDRLELGRLCRTARLPLVHGAVNGWYGQIGVQTVKSNLIERLYSKAGQEKASPSVLAPTVMYIGSVQAAETCKLLLGKASTLHNSWLSADLCTPTFDRMDNR